ncbi:hypothetical protein [Actinomadura sp. NPDC049753]|uniref:hypothetical protein n=1 Tax=Actinomadura sp. NPDC049753 TaxID=3154739 RepID=UPI0034441D5C
MKEESVGSLRPISLGAKRFLPGTLLGALLGTLILGLENIDYVKHGDLSPFTFGAFLGAVGACIGGLYGNFLAKRASGEGATAMRRGLGLCLVAITVISVSLFLLLDVEIGGQLAGSSSLIVGVLCATRGVGR